MLISGREFQDCLFAPSLLAMLFQPLGNYDRPYEFLDCRPALCCLVLYRMICFLLQGLHELLVVPDRSASVSHKSLRRLKRLVILVATRHHFGLDTCLSFREKWDTALWRMGQQVACSPEEIVERHSGGARFYLPSPCCAKQYYSLQSIRAVRVHCIHS